AAPKVNVSGTGTFTNEDLHLDIVSKQFDWTERHGYSSGSHSREWYTFYPPGPSAPQVDLGGNPYSVGAASIPLFYGQYYYETGRTTLPSPPNLGAGIFATDLKFANTLT